MHFGNNEIIKRFINVDERTEGSSTMAIITGLFAAFGGIVYGYDTGLISGMLAMRYVLETFPEDYPGNGVDVEGVFSSSEHSLIVSILSAGTFFGSLSAPFFADTLGRRWTLIIATFIVFNFGIILQTASTGINLLVAGRSFAGLGVGLISATVPIYQAETVPRYIRGAITSLYQFAITLGLLLAAIINQATHNIDNTASYRVPIALQFLWSLILTISMVLLPETPRFFISKNEGDKAAESLSRLRGLPTGHPWIITELSEIRANYEYELTQGKSGWIDCFKNSNKQLKRLMTGTFLQAFQQLTGVNFVFYFGTTFFRNSGVKNEFLVQVAINLVNVGMTIPGVIGVELLGRRSLLLIGAAGMCVSELLIAIIGTTTHSDSASKSLIALTCIFIAFFASTWGPVCWVIIGEIFPLRTRAKSAGIATASNWLWNFGLSYATPYLVDDSPGSARLQSKVFFIWGGCAFLCFLFTFFFVYETKGLSLEQIDELYDTVSNAWTSSKFVPEIDRCHNKPANSDDGSDNKHGLLYFNGDH